MGSPVSVQFNLMEDIEERAISSTHSHTLGILVARVIA